MVELRTEPKNGQHQQAQAAAMAPLCRFMVTYCRTLRGSSGVICSRGLGFETHLLPSIYTLRAGIGRARFLTSFTISAFARPTRPFAQPLRPSAPGASMRANQGSGAMAMVVSRRGRRLLAAVAALAVLGLGA